MASGNSLVSFAATDNHPPASAYATPDVRNSHPVLNFDASAAENACFQAVLARHYGGGGITLALVWMAKTATSGNVMWTAAFEKLPGTDHDTDNFATAQAAAAAAANGTSGVPTVTTIAFTNAQIASLAAGDAFRLKVTRDATNGSDTMNADDAQLVAVELKET